MPKTNIYHLSPNKNGTWDIIKKGDKQPAARLIPIKEDAGKGDGIGDNAISGHLQILKQDGTLLGDFDSILDSLRKKMPNYSGDGHESPVNTYQVKPHVKKGWIVIKQGNKKPYKRFEMRKDAIARAKELAKRNRPSAVEIYKFDGVLQVVGDYPMEIVVG